MENKIKFFDPTIPGKKPLVGHLHPITQLQLKIEDFFKGLGFSVIDDNEIVTVYDNFDALNIPDNHPARDMLDTFYLDDGRVLRAHTSATQVKYLANNQPPLRIIVPGRCYRNERTDSTHDYQFHQFECLLVDQGVKIAHFKAILQAFFKDMFGKDTEMRLRPGYFPFVEPGFEVDIKRKSDKNWLEMGGAGMVHPNVFKNAGHNPKHWQGFAWGFGLERIAMIKWNIDDIRLFHGGDLRFLKQF